MHIQYLEIVTADVEAACALYAKLQGMTFNEPDQNLGGARPDRPFGQRRDTGYSRTDA